MNTFELPKLPYALDALGPQISGETMDYHYNKHLKAYVDKLNELIKGTEFENMALEDIVAKSSGAIFNNAGQTWNHTFFFLGLSPSPKSKPSGGLAAAIDREFGSFDKLKEAFVKAGVGQFGSGWVWLVKDKSGKPAIISTANADSPLTKEGQTPVLVLDVWEHAYYIDHRNRRQEYLEKAWDKIDWAVVEKRFAE